MEDLALDELDSPGSEELLMGLEKEFGIRIPDADAQALHTLRDIVEYLDRRGVSP
jgi:acyl carrier protein